MSEMSVFIRCDKRTFERAYQYGVPVLVYKVQRSELSDQVVHKSHVVGHTRVSAPTLLEDMLGDAPSRSGEVFGYYIQVSGGAE